MNKFQAQHLYWNGFGLPAFNEQTVPDVVPDGKGGTKKLVPPFITYEPITGRLDGTILQNARVYYRGKSWSPIMQKVTEIEKVADRQIPVDGGAMKVRVPLSNFAQPLSDPTDDQLRTMVLQVEVEFLTY